MLHVVDRDREKGRKELEVMMKEKHKIEQAASMLRPGFPGWGAAIFQEVRAPAVCSCTCVWRCNV